MKKCAIYLRCSTNNGKQDLDTQLIPLKSYAESRGWQYEIYSDEMSGSKESRPALDRLFKDAYKRKFDAVIVFRFDRFSRSTKQLITALETFRSLGIDFISYNEAIDTTTPAGQMMFTIISAFASFERSIIQERVRAGLYKAKAKGKVLGRPKTPVDIQKVTQLKSQGLSVRKIAKKLDIPKSTICNFLSKYYNVDIK